MISTDISEISLERGPCFGTCPVFKFTASRHNGYSYDGRWHVEPLGSKLGRFPGYLFDRLAEVCVELRVLELDDLYPCHIDDVPFVRVEVRYRDGIKVVHSEGGNSGPVRLWAFAALIEVAMREAFSCETREKRPARKGGKRKG